VNATVVHTMQPDDSLQAEYWRGGKVTARAHLMRAVREGPGQ
jgi:hypothetical protein